MNYQTYPPHHDLAPLVKCYWTLEVPAEAAARQRIIPDGCLEMFFILGHDVKRYTSEIEYIIQPRAMVLGQITEPFFIEPMGHVSTFAVRFYPYGFANFVSKPIKNLANKETPLSMIFDKKDAADLEQSIIKAKGTKARIKIVEKFLLARLNDQISIDDIVKDTLDTMFLSHGSTSVKVALKDDLSKRRQLERKFTKQVGISPKQLSKVIRLQAALKMMLEARPESFNKIAYDSNYYDQAHFIKDFREFTGTTPKEFFDDKEMALSSVVYKN